VLVKPIVHVERARPVCGEPVYVIEVGVVAAAMVTFEPGLAGVVSADVATVKFAAVIVWAAGFVTPTIARVPAALFARAQEAPASVTVSVGPVADPDVAVVVPVAVQLEKLPPGVMVGLVGTLNPAENWIVTVSPTLSAPVEVAVKPTVYVERERPVCGDPVYVIDVGVVAAAMTTFEAGLAEVMSSLVLTVKVVFVYVAAVGL
jgi:hypothetical protein